MTTTEPINVAYGGFRHRAQVEALVVSSMCPPDADPEAYLDNFRDRAWRAVRTILMVNGDEVIGHVIVEKPGGHIGRQWATFVGSNTVEISALAVDPYFRECGIGRWLFEDAIRFAVANSYQPVCVTAVDNDPVQRMLSKLNAAPRRPFWVGERHYQPFVLPTS